MMEFLTEWSVFQADLFETAARRSHGKAVMELMIQARPNGKLLDLSSSSVDVFHGLGINK